MRLVYWHLDVSLVSLITVSWLLSSRTVVLQSNRMQVNSQRQVEWTRQLLATALATGARINAKKHYISIVNIRCQLFCGCVIEYECAVSVLPFPEGFWCLDEAVCCLCCHFITLLCIYLYIYIYIYIYICISGLSANSVMLATSCS